MSTAKPFLAKKSREAFERVWKRRIEGVTGLTDRLDELINAALLAEGTSWAEARPG
jgi:hypothetical protein